MTLPELLIPAGTFRKIQVALAYGADAVYVGAAGFSMRPDGASFSVDDLHEAVAYVHEHGKRLYVAVNSLIMQDELPALRRWLEDTQDIPFDALVIADPALMLLTQEIRPDVEVHISTQMSTANALAAKFWKNAGAKRIILARECSLAEAKQISQAGELPVEIFIHGAMCVAVSGRCLLSAHMAGRNASKGDCKHSCRWQWELREAKRSEESFPVIETGRNTIILSSTDLCLLEHIPEVIESGVASLKVEGRMKSECYIAAVARSYRAALDACAADPARYQCDPQWIKDVHSVRHHPYSTGFAFGYPTENPESLQASCIDGGSHDFVALVESKNGAGFFVDAKHPFQVGETLERLSPGSSGETVAIQSITDQNGLRVQQAHPGARVQITLKDQNDLFCFDILRREKKTPRVKQQRTE